MFGEILPFRRNLDIFIQKIYNVLIAKMWLYALGDAGRSQNLCAGILLKEILIV